MAEDRQVVFGEIERTDRLPDWASTGTVVIEWMQQHGLWEQATERLKIQREGGYAGIDALLFLVYFFTSGLRLGVKEFSERTRKHHAQLAAVGGRRRLPTQSSMSRILSAVDSERTKDFGSWLLLEAPGVSEVLHHPSVLTRDALSAGWHVFDWDPTVTTLRHRALPVFDGMPNARRRSEALAEPGYSGRKRGDVQFSRGTLQHAGSGLWLGIEMAPGNGELRGAFQSAVDQVVATCDHADIAPERVLLRADGVAGNVPFITACVEAGLHYITRLQHYQLLEDPEVAGHLNEAGWFEVPSSGSGPARQAADLGLVTLEPAATSRHEDGSPFAPIETRVVVSRFPSSGAGHGAGVELDGWQYELYATDLPPAPWPEGEIVAGYYGRTGQENRFHQEDRELGLDRIFSYHLPGQQLATLVGLFVWNFFICRGINLARPPLELPEQQALQALPITTPPAMPVVGSNDASVDVEEVQPALAPSTDVEEEVESSIENGTGLGSTARHEFIRALDAINWEPVLDRHEGWKWLAHKGGLRCPNEAVLPFVRVEKVGHRIRARFIANLGTCDSCKLRQTCSRSNDPHYRRDIRLTIPSPHAEPLRLEWLASRTAQPVIKRRRKSNAEAQRKRGKPIWRIKPLLWRPPETPQQRASFAVGSPVLLPATLRKMTRSAAQAVEVQVAVEQPPDPPKPSLVLALSPAERQKRRLSWEQRLRWNELPDRSHILVRFLGEPILNQILSSSTQGGVTGGNAT